jgi:hypothetical protein
MAAYSDGGLLCFLARIVQIVAVTIPIMPMATMMAVVYEATKAVAFSNTLLPPGIP